MMLSADENPTNSSSRSKLDGKLGYSLKCIVLMELGKLIRISTKPVTQVNVIFIILHYCYYPTLLLLLLFYCSKKNLAVI